MRLVVYTNAPILARGLQSCFLGEVPETALTTVSGGREELFKAMGNEPELLLFDFTPETDFSLLVEVMEYFPACKVVLWVTRLSVELSCQAMKLRVFGILRKTEPPDVLIECLRRVAAGEYWFDQESRSDFFDSRSVPLTARETQLVILISQGLKNKEIATALSISEATVRIYLSALFRKLAIKDRYELAIYGIKNLMGGMLTWESDRTLRRQNAATLLVVDQRRQSSPPQRAATEKSPAFAGR